METRTTVNDSQRMKVHIGDTENQGFKDFYPFPEPNARMQTEASGVRETLYWIGAVGATVAAGVAVWFLFSSEEEDQVTHVVVQ